MGKRVFFNVCYPHWLRVGGRNFYRNQLRLNSCRTCSQIKGKPRQKDMKKSPVSLSSSS